MRHAEPVQATEITADSQHPLLSEYEPLPSGKKTGCAKVQIEPLEAIVYSSLHQAAELY